MERLRLNLAIGLRIPVGDSQIPSELWRSRIASRKIAVSPRHADFPILIAEAMDFIEASSFDVSQAAQRLSISNSQLIKFVKSVASAFTWLNENREKLGLRSLK